MTAKPEISRSETVQSGGDWGLRGLDVDQVYARFQLSDDALTAAVWATAKFHRTFPGWQLFRRIRAGMTVFDDELDAWVVGGATLLARSRKRNGRCYVEARGPWVAQAARDALCAVERVSNVWETYPSAWARAGEFGVEPRTWMKIYKPVVAMLVVGLETFASELRAEYRRVKIQTPENAVNLAVSGDMYARAIDFASGNRVTPHHPNGDQLSADTDF